MTLELRENILLHPFLAGRSAAANASSGPMINPAQATSPTIPITAIVIRNLMDVGSDELSEI